MHSQVILYSIQIIYLDKYQIHKARLYKEIKI